jgi:hypothetical protein
MDDSTFYNVCLHEIGHALGLGHSSKPIDIMYFAGLNRGKGLPHLSANDIVRIRRMYSDPLLGRDVAEQFSEAAFVAGDFEKAYELLSPGIREKLSLSAFRESVAIKQPPPVSLKVTHFERTKSNLFNYGLEGVSSQAKFYYHVAIRYSPRHKFSVDQTNLVDMQPLKQ